MCEILCVIPTKKRIQNTLKKDAVVAAADLPHVWFVLTTRTQVGYYNKAVYLGVSWVGQVRAGFQC